MFFATPLRVDSQRTKSMQEKDSVSVYFVQAALYRLRDQPLRIDALLAQAGLGNVLLSGSFATLCANVLLSSNFALLCGNVLLSGNFALLCGNALLSSSLTMWCRFR
ncbi:hypothetical protein D3C85_987380 [compost metagenome]